jgi:hypothetical protein
MKEKPILFNTEMVKAILDGRKTQTRRIIKADKIIDANLWNDTISMLDFSPYQVGDILWVRETFVESDNGYLYKADPMFDTTEIFDWKWEPSIFMPRQACRMELEVIKVRVERLNDISEEDAEAEGSKYKNNSVTYDGENCRGSYKNYFRSLWESINGKGSWEANPFVWAIKFKKL